MKIMNSEKSKIAINNFMTPNIKSIQPDINIKDAAKIMYEYHLPSLLVEEKGQMIGIITYADIALALTIFENKPTSQIREIMSSADSNAIAVRVGVKSGGCAGLSYVMEYAEDIKPNEEIIDQKGVEKNEGE